MPTEHEPLRDEAEARAEWRGGNDREADDRAHRASEGPADPEAVVLKDLPQSPPD